MRVWIRSLVPAVSLCVAATLVPGTPAAAAPPAVPGAAGELFGAPDGSPEAAGPGPLRPGVPVRGWTILSDSDAGAYFGYRVYVQGVEQQTPQLTATIQAGLRETRNPQVVAAIRAYPDQPPTGEWNWTVDAGEADKYVDRITNGWDRYGGIKVPAPTR
jgi:hypothetical protein